MSIVTRALDSLALALVEHGHTWTSEQRNLYESATRHAIATETQRAETENTGSVEDEGAGPKDIAQKGSSNGI